MFYSYKNLKLQINSGEIYANSIGINCQNQLEPIYLTEQRHSFDYAASDGLNNSIRLNYYLTGVDPLKTFIQNETSSISGYLGGLAFQTGYLRSYELTAVPNEPVNVNAEIVFFDELKGLFSPSYEKIVENNVLNYADATITLPATNTIGDLTNATRVSFSFNSDIQTSYEIGKIIPEISFANKEISAEIECDNLSGHLAVTGERAAIQINFTHPALASLSESFLCDGFIYKREISTSPNQFIKAVIGIKENHTNSPPTITGWSPLSGGIGSGIIITGTNFTNAVALYFADTKDETFTILSDTRISGNVPVNVIDGDFKVVAPGGEATSGDFYVIQNPLTVSGVTPITGAIGSRVLISGSNFYRISNVTFSESSNASGDFSVISSNFIEATVPNRAAWDFVKVYSTSRNLTGTSPLRFAPIPNVDGFNPTTGIIDTIVNITGAAFSGITGVYFNGISGNNLSVVSNSGLNILIPSGNTRGIVKLVGQSGVSNTGFFLFNPIVSITGTDPISGATGAAIDVLGVNFIPEIMASGIGLTNMFLVGFNGGTGLFGRTSDTTMTGLVPTTAKNGPVYIYQENGVTTYPSAVTFKVLNPLPTITLITPSSGKRLDYSNALGTNLLDITKVSLTGNGTGALITTYSNNSEGELLNFQVPINITGGAYYLRVDSITGAASGQYRVLEVPHISGFTPLSGAVGTRVTLSGLNLYNFSKVYINTTGTLCPVDTGSFTSNYNTLDFFIPNGALTGNKVIVYNEVDYNTGVDQFVLIARPYLANFTPGSGEYGSGISITGNNLNYVSGVYIGNRNVSSFTKVGSTGISFNIPDYANSDYITVKSQAGESTSLTRLIVQIPNIQISGFTPISGYVGDTIVVSGKYIDTTNYVLVSGQTGRLALDDNDFNRVGITGINFAIPQTAQTDYLRLQNDRYTQISTSLLTILDSPIISTLTPDSGYFRQLISISGSSLTGVEFFFNGVTGNLIRALSTSVVAGTGATLLVPREISRGNLTISGNSRLFPTNQTFTPLPSVTGFSPTGLLSGAILTVTGINAWDALSNVGISGKLTHASIIDSDDIGFNFFNLTGSHVQDFTTGAAIITGTVNSNFFGTGRLFLVSQYDNVLGDFTTISGSSAGSNISNLLSTFLITIQQSAPILTSFSPLSGNSGTLVSITGKNLGNATGVYFTSGLTQTSGYIQSNTQNNITVLPPTFSQESGHIVVYTDFGNATNTGWFTFVNYPVISGFYPTGNYYQGKIIISGSNLNKVTGLYFGNYTGVFSFGQTAGGVHEITGTVPLIDEIPPRLVNLRVYNQAGYAESGLFELANHLYNRDNPSGFLSRSESRLNFLMQSSSVLTTGLKGYIHVPYLCAVTGWTFTANQTGNLSMNVHQMTYANFYRENSIVGTEKPLITGDWKGQDLNLTTWATGITGGNILAFIVESVASIKTANLSLHCIRT